MARSSGKQLRPYATESAETFLQDVYAGRVWGVYLSPDTATWRSARLRSCKWPRELADLDPKNTWSARRANAELDACLATIDACDKTVTPWCLEHSWLSFLFCDVFLRDRAARPACEEATADFCACGSRWRRRTRFLVGNCDQLDVRKLARRCYACKGVCPYSNQTHRRLKGRCPSGCSWAWIAQKHPASLAYALSSTLLASARATFHRPYHRLGNYFFWEHILGGERSPSSRLLKAAMLHPRRSRDRMRQSSSSQKKKH